MTEHVPVHLPVMVTEVVEKLLHNTQGTYLDATFGRGGHSRAMLAVLARDARVLGLDRDDEAVLVGQRLAAEDARFSMVKSRFGAMRSALEAIGETSVDGVLMDIGVSSPQLDDAERGFSFRAEGPLDMRMDQAEGESAADWINSASSEEISDVLYKLGEERFARRIATRIVESRPFNTTTELAEVIAGAIPARSRTKESKHPATRSFQAIRMHVNKELDELEAGLNDAWMLLNDGGRLAVISFHSLEDRIVKTKFRQWSQPPNLPRRMPVPDALLKPEGRLVGKAIKAGPKEVTENPRARSAVLRVIEKQATDSHGS